MRTPYRFSLEQYKGLSTRYICPGCQNRGKTFSRYVDIETNVHVHPTVGRCNRESNCGYHYTPKQYFQDNSIFIEKTLNESLKPPMLKVESKTTSTISTEVFKSSLIGYESNHFVTYLLNLFGSEITCGLISRYYIGSSNHWNGSTVFWQIDIAGKVRAGKVMLYAPNTGKRVKSPFNHITWIHKVCKMSGFELKQCLFGEHLLSDKSKAVAIVESEKTAVVASVYFPQFIWLAAGSLNNLSEERCNVLRGRRVLLYPDINGFEKWRIKAKELSHMATFQVSDLLEQKATAVERERGFDLADYLIKFNFKEFLPEEQEASSFLPIDQTECDLEPIEQPKQIVLLSKSVRQEPENWDKEISELENYFNQIELPELPVKLNGYTTIKNCAGLIENHLIALKANNGNRTYKIYLERLHALNNVLK